VGDPWFRSHPRPGVSGATRVLAVACDTPKNASLAGFDNGESRSEAEPGIFPQQVIVLAVRFQRIGTF